MELYNMVRVLGRAVKVARFTSRKAKQCEQDLHKAFDLVRFNQTRTRRVFKALCQALYIYLVYYGATSYNLNPEQLDIAYKGSIAMFFVLFHAEIKIGISNNTERRVAEVSEDFNSGYTEWFAIPWPLMPFIPIATWFRVAPAKASVFTALYSGIIFLLIKTWTK
jgi:hypothetical protein